MPRTVKSNGIKPQYKALEVIKLGVPFAPSDVDAHVGTGAYCAKYLTFLRRDGFEFEAVKDGRKIVSYTLVKEPENASEFRSLKPKEKAVKAPKEPKEKKLPKAYAKLAKPPKVKKVAAAKKSTPKKGGNAANLAKLKALGKKFSPKLDSDEPAEVFGDTGVVGSIDSGWDSTDGLNLKDLL